MKPTIVADVEQSDEIVQDEVFGPVVTMQRFSSDDEAIAMANGVRYGLAASVFSENVGRALSAARELDFGTVWMNEHLFPLASEMPHGGFKQSGYGKDMTLYSHGGVHAHQARRREARLMVDAMRGGGVESLRFAQSSAGGRGGREREGGGRERGGGGGGERGRGGGAGAEEGGGGGRRERRGGEGGGGDSERTANGAPSRVRTASTPPTSPSSRPCSATAASRSAASRAPSAFPRRRCALATGGSATRTSSR